MWCDLKHCLTDCEHCDEERGCGAEKEQIQLKEYIEELWHDQTYGSTFGG